MRKTPIVAVSICLAISLSASIYMLSNKISSKGFPDGETPADPGIEGYGGLFVSLVLAYFLFLIVREERRRARK
jgi:hypothetical protein